MSAVPENSCPCFLGRNAGGKPSTTFLWTEEGEQSLLAALLTISIAASIDYFKGTGLRDEHFSAHALTAFETFEMFACFHELTVLTNSKTGGSSIRNCM